MHHLYNGSDTTADRTDKIVPEFSRKASVVASATATNMPSVPKGPNQSTISLVNLNGTVSGTVKHF